MRNLAIFQTKVTRFQGSHEENFLVCRGNNSRTVTTSVISHNLSVSNFDENGVVNWSKDLSELVSSDNSPVNVTYLSLSAGWCAGFGNGELFYVSEDGSSCDLVGACEDGLLAMEWSPDQELLVLVTKSFNTILMSCTYDPINEVNLLDQGFGEKQFITVGWGKKETQFHGSEGKQAAKAKTEVNADPNAAEDILKITWRGDGQLYAVGFTQDGLRRFKVFDREGQLQYTSEKQPGLQSQLCWRPSGNVITTTQKFPDKYDISFFEKNGLKHGGFTLPISTTTEVEDITWNSDSEILAIQCFDTTDNTQRIMLYTTGNYHWYLKQVLTFNPGQKVSKIIWDNDFDVNHNKTLHVYLTSGEHYSYSWMWTIDHSVGTSIDDNAVVAVIDGNKILVTGFRQTVVPPPMAAFDIELDTFVNSIHFAPKLGDTDPNSFFACTCDNKLVFYQLINKFPLQYKVTKTIAIDKYSFPFQKYSWFWMADDTVMCASLDYAEDFTNTHNLIEFKLSDSLTVTNTQNYSAVSITGIQSHPTDKNVVYVNTDSNEVFTYICGLEKNCNEIGIQLSNELCPKFSVLAIDDDLQFIGLSLKGNLYINDTKVLSNISSYFVHSHFLLLTTTLKHLLLCVELSKDGLDALKDYQKNDSPKVYKRKIETGAKLVIAVAQDTRTVFQLPRGNLEAIQPRPLSLKIIGDYLSDLKYYEAFDLMRKQRINLNLIYDHDPEKFLNNIDVFLNSIKNNSWLSLFLSDLENLDVTKTMYATSYNNGKTTNGSDTKIQRICDIIRTHLENIQDKENKILPLITTYVKKNTVVDLENALSVVKKLKEQESAGSKLPVGSDEALKYLLYMVDVSNLFDIALGMYDFDLVLLVANKSQKDPKEYIPMLNELNEMEENYKRFTINKRLKRFDRAVDCLAACGPDKHEELRSFVKYHSLYRKCLELFKPEDEIYKQVSDDYGLFLKLEKQYTEAGIIYRRSKNYEKAIECFKEDLEWELAIELTEDWPKEQRLQLCRELFEGLKDNNRSQEALTVLERYTDDPEDTIKHAVTFGCYKTALRLCSQFGKDNLKNELILPAIMAEFNNTQQQIETYKTTFIKQRDRLQVVRETKKQTPFEDYDASYANKDSDLYSDAGSTLASTTSRSSSRTFRSSKNRRKHERKVASCKEGSQYEDVGLVIALHNLVKSAFDLRLHVRELCLALSCFECDKETFVLQRSLQNLLKDMKDSFKDVWTSDLVLEATNAEIAARNVPEGFSVAPQGIASLDAHLRIAPVIPDVKWELKGFN